MTKDDDLSVIVHAEIERALGHHGNKVAMRAIVGIVVALLIQTVIGALVLAEWKGAITARLESHVLDGHPNVVISRVTSLESRAAVSDERLSTLSANIQEIKALQMRHFDELKRLIMGRP